MLLTSSKEQAQQHQQKRSTSGFRSSGFDTNQQQIRSKTMSVFTASNKDDHGSENIWFDTFKEAKEYAEAWAVESELDINDFYIIESESEETYAKEGRHKALSLENGLYYEV
jgi:hypothetical protein